MYLLIKVKNINFVLNVLLTRFYVNLEPVLIAKSNIILDVKPWDDETDMKELEKEVRNVSMDGLVWGACELLLLFCSNLLNVA